MVVTGRGRKQGWGTEPGGSQMVPGQKPSRGGHRKGNTGTRDPSPTEMGSWLRAGTGCCPHQYHEMVWVGTLKSIQFQPC